MIELQGSLILADGRRISGFLLRLDEQPGFWSGTILVPPQHRQVVGDAFRQRVQCDLLLEDGRTGRIVLTGFGAMTRFKGIGPLSAPPR